MATNNYTVKDGNGAAIVKAATDTTGSAGPLADNVLLVDASNNPTGLASAANLATESGAKALLTAPPGQWTVNHVPAANTQATATKAAGAAGVRHVCTALSFSVAADGTAPTATQLTVNLRDGASGAGTVLMSWIVAIPAVAGEVKQVSLSGLNIVGSAATAMTLEFAAAGGAHTYESVNIAGYDAS
jgi:hypothetical protein